MKKSTIKEKNEISIILYSIYPAIKCHKLGNFFTKRNDLYPTGTGKNSKYQTLTSHISRNNRIAFVLLTKKNKLVILIYTYFVPAVSCT